MQQKRCRATVIVEVEDTVLLAINKNDLVLLPGGGINREELPFAAAARELHEETGLVAKALTFQQIILKLQSYWDAQGCVLMQPYDMEVGAGTSHTATFLRAIGPEPWNAAYVQPSRRPKDGRYGENPNR